MQEKVLRKKVNKDNFYNSYLKCLNGYLNLTPREFEVLVELCKFQSEANTLNYSEEDLSDHLLGTKARARIRAKLGISQYNLNNIIKTLKEKAIIYSPSNKIYSLNPQLYIPLVDNEYQISYKLEVSE